MTVPANDPARLSELLELGILDTLPEPRYDDVVRLAAVVADTPIAIMNFVDADRQWGKALIGVEDSEASREASFCARTIVADDGVMVVPDTHADPRFATNPQVTGGPLLRFYAGVAVVSAQGHALGTVCVADRRPRELPESTLEALKVLARQTAALLEVRLTARKLADANEQLARLAIHDELTGLVNRRFVNELLPRLLASHGRSGRPLGVLLADVDGLKAVNDQHGHAAGDALLRAVAERLQTAARAKDVVARVSGDEFLVICPDLSHPDDLRQVAARLGTAVAVPGRAGETILTPTVSIGTALATATDDVEHLIARADEAMYAVKRGR